MKKVVAFLVCAIGPVTAAPIHDAVESGDYQKVEQLIEQKVNLDAPNEYGLAPLHLAASHGNIKIVQLLLENGADAHIQATQGKIPLHYAAEEGSTEIVRLFIEQKVQPNVTTDKGDTPVHEAVSAGNMDTLKVLLHNEADLHIANADGDTPLYIAVRRGHAEIVELLLLYTGDVYVSQEHGTELLSIALSQQQLEIASILVSYGVRIDADKQQSQDEHTSDQRHQRVLHELQQVAQGDVPELRHISVMSALRVLAGRGHNAVFLRLYEEKHTDILQNSLIEALITAVGNGNVALVQKLVDRTVLSKQDCIRVFNGVSEYLILHQKTDRLVICPERVRSDILHLYRIIQSAGNERDSKTIPDSLSDRAATMYRQMGRIQGSQNGNTS